MFDLIREIAQTLRNNRLRTILTGLAVAWGIFMLIVLLGASKGVMQSFEHNSSEMGSNNSMTIFGGRTSKPYKGYKEGRWISLKNSDIDKIEHDNREIVSKVISYASENTNISTPRDFVSEGFDAVYPDAIKTNNLGQMKYGRFINDRDMEERRRVMVLASTHARMLFPTEEEAVGGVVTSMGLAWTVIGVYEHPWRSGNYVPYTTYKAITGNTDEAYKLDVTVEGLKTEADGIAAENAIRQTLARSHEFDPEDQNSLWVWNKFVDYLTTRAGLGYLDLAVWVIGIFTLLSGIVGISNIMFVSVRERTHEIGIRRAIGAKPRNILTQILLESVVITTIFGYIGVVFGTAVLQLISAFVPEMAYVAVDLNLAFKVTVALIVAGCVAGLFPALKAIKVKPVEALRDE